MRFTENDIKEMAIKTLLNLKENVTLPYYYNNDKFKYPINERFSEKLYHFTTIPILEKILTNNVLLLTHNLTNSVDYGINYKINPNYEYYMSFTRDKCSRNGYAGYKNGYFDKELDVKRDDNFLKNELQNKLWVRLEIDGEYLNYNNKYKGAPVNYHHYRNNKNAISMLPDNEKVKYRQSEDRLLSKLPYIRIADKNGNNLGIVKRIDIFIPTEYRFKDKNKRATILKYLKWCIDENKAFSINTENNPNGNIFIYDNILDFDMQSNKTSNEYSETKLEPSKDVITPTSAKKIIPYIWIRYYYLRVIENQPISIDDVIDKIVEEYFKTFEEATEIDTYEKSIKILMEYFNETRSFYEQNPTEIFKNLNNSFFKDSFKGVNKLIYLNILSIFKKMLNNTGAVSVDTFKRKLHLKAPRKNTIQNKVSTK